MRNYNESEHIIESQIIRSNPVVPTQQNKARSPKWTGFCISGRARVLQFNNFKFKAGDLNFKSNEYEWLVIAGSKAMFKGTGAINGIDGYGFFLSAIDSDLTPGAETDRFRIKIWELVNEDIVIYDNDLNENEIDAPPSTDIAGSLLSTRRIN